MAIDLLRSFVQKGQTTNTQPNTIKSSGSQTLPQNLQVMRAMRALQAGQTLRGEIVSVDGENVQLAIMKNVLIDAKLTNGMSLTPGMNMSFQVKSNNSSGLSLMPLFTNTAVDPNAAKALDMAGIPTNERSMEMVQTLMQKGMPIDKQSLQNMYREVVANKDAAVRDIITLHQMEIPVTAANLEQLNLYENNQHFLANTFSDIGQALGEQIAGWVQNGDIDAAKNFLQNLTQIFRGGEAAAEGNVLPEGNAALVNSTETTVVPEGGKAVTVFTEDMLPAQNGQGKEAGQISNAVNASMPEAVLNPAAESKEQTAATVNPLPEEVIGDGEQTAVFKEGEVSDTAKESSNTKLQWSQLLETLVKEKSPDKIAEAFKKVWDSDIKNQWMLEPETVADKEQIQEFYDKLTKQVKQLESLLDTSPNVQGSVSKAVQNTASNLDFMNQLNQMSAYIQLPLKLANQNAHGELYVYTNKKSLAKQDGKVTALLHLSMEHLGNMDIYVSLENQKVGTKFTLENEDALDFLEAHMDILTERLNKRGYECKIQSGLRTEETESVMKKIEKQADSPILLSTQAFDMRA